MDLSPNLVNWLGALAAVIALVSLPRNQRLSLVAYSNRLIDHYLCDRIRAL
jgi:hypothetical protein